MVGLSANAAPPFKTSSFNPQTDVIAPVGLDHTVVVLCSCPCNQNQVTNYAFFDDDAGIVFVFLNTPASVATTDFNDSQVTRSDHQQGYGFITANTTVNKSSTAEQDDEGSRHDANNISISAATTDFNDSQVTRSDHQQGYGFITANTTVNKSSTAEQDDEGSRHDANNISISTATNGLNKAGSQDFNFDGSSFG
jgi:ribonuclease PH